MDGQNPVLIFILEWVWVPIVGTLVWSIKKLINVDEKHTEAVAKVNMRLAVMDEGMLALKEELAKIDTRNEAAHLRFETKIDSHHDRVMRRLDSLMTLLSNTEE